jgi:hypothetical protein
MKVRIIFVGLVTFFALACLYGNGLCQPIMVEKNLFSPDRTPTSDEDPGVDSPDKRSQGGLPPRAVQLDGVFIRDDAKKALLRVNSQLLGGGRERGKDPFPYMTVSEGESIGDYKVAKIEARSVSLEKDSQLHVISLFMDGKVSPPVMTIPVAPVSPETDAPQAPPGAEIPEQPQESAQVPEQQDSPPAAQPPRMPAAPQPPGVGTQPSDGNVQASAGNVQPPAENVQAPARNMENRPAPQRQPRRSPVMPQQ